jgi:hypothetical protein
MHRTMVVSTRDFSATLEIGVTIPIASTSTGTGLRSALASSTETTRGRCGPCALAPPPIHDERVTKAATRAMPARPQKYQITFFHNISRQPVHKGPGRPGSNPLTATFAPYF